MPSSLLAPIIPKEDSDLPVLKALGRPPIPDEGTEMGPPPAAEHRAETAFETMGFVLVLLLIIAAAWILARRRL